MKKKEENKAKLLDYLGNPKNQYLSRDRLGLEVLGYAQGSSIYLHFTPDELCQIEAEALEIRRKKYSPELSKADKALLKRAAKGDPAAVKLAYQRFEGWSEKQELRVTGLDEIQIRALTLMTSPEWVEQFMQKCAELKGQAPKKIT